MLNKGNAVKISIYLTDSNTSHGVPTSAAILDFLFKNAVSGATLLKGVAGFGHDHHLHTSASIFLADHLPLKVEFIESREKAEEIMPALTALAGTGMIEMQETFIVKTAG